MYYIINAEIFIIVTFYISIFCNVLYFIFSSKILHIYYYIYCHNEHNRPPSRPSVITKKYTFPRFYRKFLFLVFPTSLPDLPCVAFTTRQHTSSLNTINGHALERRKTPREHRRGYRDNSATAIAPSVCESPLSYPLENHPCHTNANEPGDPG